MSKDSPMLFGWCLPDAPEAIHANCTGSFEYANTVTCGCLCHTDIAAWKKSLAKAVVKRKGATNTNKSDTPKKVTPRIRKEKP
ncbi:hypothetical protein UFOVP46_99 [uncultured Caudovirales phage]|uniref:Uncharacterized protein n=1 Tax=uncultured Caudovirales phage TaxID=2100421 RepID=A0A6J5KRY6_9CAUD|nr:hypothetical protein UFOVP46_99 [uncultured Caudovirales phage]